VKSWQNIKHDKSPASYISAMASTSLIDVQRKFDTARRKVERLENEKRDNFYEDFKSSPPRHLLVSMKAGEKSIIRRQVIQFIKKGVSKKELSRTTGFHINTIRKWFRLYEKYGAKFYTMDRRNMNGRKPKL